MLAATQASVPLWTWVFFVLAIGATLAVISFGLRRANVGRSSRASRRTKGLSPEQQAFQEEMRLMLEVRLRERLSAELQQESAGEPSNDKVAGEP